MKKLMNPGEIVAENEMLQAALSVEDYVLRIRRDLHRHPEISLQETRTMALVRDELDAMNIPHETVKDGGIIGVIEGEGGGEGKTLILRADLDALPMKEEEMNLKQKKAVVSENDQAAHTCGHDGHTAMLLGAAKILSANRNRFKGEILLAFEQGEENGAGIKNLLPRLVEIGADGVWGIHLKSDIPSAQISVDPGPRMAGAFLFDVSIRGKSGHGSRPDLAISPLDCFTDFYQSLTSMRLSSLNPFDTITYSVGHVGMGSAPNIIPDELRFTGTARYLNPDQGSAAAAEFIRLLDKLCEVHHCTHEYHTRPVASEILVYNHPACSEIAAQSVKTAVGKEHLYLYPAWMASEPFAYYQQYFPGVFAFVGIENEQKGTGAEHHNAFFDLDEDALKYGVAATAQYALDFLLTDKDIEFSAETRPLHELINT